jgi:hypothetical protein
MAGVHRLVAGERVGAQSFVLLRDTEQPRHFLSLGPGRTWSRSGPGVAPPNSRSCSDAAGSYARSSTPATTHSRHHPRAPDDATRGNPFGFESRDLARRVRTWARRLRRRLGGPLVEAPERVRRPVSWRQQAHTPPGRHPLESESGADRGRASRFPPVARFRRYAEPRLDGRPGCRMQLRRVAAEHRGNGRRLASARAAMPPQRTPRKERGDAGRDPGLPHHRAR